MATELKEKICYLPGSFFPSPLSPIPRFPLTKFLSTLHFGLAFGDCISISFSVVKR